MKRWARSIYFFGPAGAWMALIFLMSSRAGSTEHSEALVLTLIRWVSPTFAGTLTPFQADCLDYGFRKTCHFTEYAILALLLARAAARGRRVGGRVYLTALGFCVLYAASDELHQSFVPLRTPSAADVLIDAIGTGTALAILAAAQGLGSADRRMGSRVTDKHAAESCRGGAK